jgi:hypothetical protein
MPLAFRLAALLVVCVSATTGRAQGPETLTIEFPAAVSPTTVSVWYLPPPGQAFPVTGARPSNRTYTIPVAGALPLRVLIHVPGYQLVAREFEAAEMTGTFIPPLIPLGNAPLHGRLVTSSGQPLRDTPIRLSYDLVEAMAFFGYMDGPSSVLELAHTRTADDGGFELSIPLSISDPFFQRYSRPDSQGFRLWSSERPFFWDDTLRPFAFGFQTTFVRPFVVVKSRRGNLAGRIGPAFLHEHDLPLDLGPHLDDQRMHPTLRIRLDASPSSAPLEGPRVIAYNAMLGADGTFAVDLPPGMYDLTLSILGPGGILQRRVVVDRGVQVPEGERSFIERP